MRRIMLAVVVLVSAGAVGRAAERAPALLGARAVIERAQAEAGQKAAPSNSPLMQARADLRRDLAAFQKTAINLTPKVAASMWLGLLDRFWSLPLDQDQDHFGRSNMFSGTDEGADEEDADADEAAPQWQVTIQDILKALPGPSAWSELSAQVNNRTVESDRAIKEGALKVLVQFLDGNPVKVDAAIKQFDQAIRRERGGMFFGRISGETEPIRRAWGQTKGFESPEAVVRQFREALEQKSEDEQGARSLSLPPLADLTTPEEADELLRKCLMTPRLRIEISYQGATLERLKALALQNIKALPAAPWWLVRLPSDAALFEALEKRFPKAMKATEDSNAVNPFAQQEYNYSEDMRRNAEQVYTLALLKAGRVEEMFRRIADEGEVAGEMDGEDFGWSPLENMNYGHIANLSLTDGQAAHMFKAMEPYLQKSPEHFPWSLWSSVGLMAGQGDAVVAALTAASGKSNLSTRTQLALLNQLSCACLAVDKVDASVAALRCAAALDVGKLSPDGQRIMSGRQQHMAMQLLRLGRLLNRQDLRQEGVRLAVGDTGHAEDYSGVSLGNSRYPTALGELVRAGEYAVAEQRLLHALTRVFKMPQAAAYEKQQVRQQTGQIMGALLVVYEKAGRQADALWLLDESPWWSSADLGNQQMESGLIPSAGRVLAKAGRKAEAEKLLKARLRMQPSDDEAYEALVPLQGIHLLGWLDALYAKDRFEERPLIWKAVVLKEAGRLDEAEAVIRQALKVDPTDGEQESGQRVKGYAVLGDILEAKGKAEDAKFFRNVVKAVRVAEEGDELSETGLISRSLKKYEEAEGLFVDAYCVQWRLAERLWALGKVVEANKHYAIAFERMPEQFGQVASFCFGCQGVFQKEQSRSVAEQVLTRLAQTQGQRPQVHFLLGQLREAQYRYADAFKCFKRALELDPDYLDAWEKLYGLNDELYLPKRERDDIVFRGMELDPSHRHFSGGWETVSDVRRFWELAARGATDAEPSGKVFELKGTKQAIAKDKSALTGPEVMMMARSYSFGDRDTLKKPAVLLLRHQMVQVLLNYLQ